MNQFNFDTVVKNIERTKRELPVILSKQAQSYFVNNFSVGGFDNKKWITPNRKIPGTDEYKYPKKKGLARRTKPTLVMSGALRRDVSNSIKQATWDKVLLRLAMPYATFHQEGTDNMPRRPIFGQTQTLTNMQNKTITQYFDKVWH